MTQFLSDQVPGGPKAGVTLGEAGEDWLRTNEIWINKSAVAELTRELRDGGGVSLDEGLLRD